MAVTQLTPSTPRHGGRVKVQGAKSSTNIATLYAGIVSALGTYFDGTAGTHPSYTVEVKIRPIET